MRTKSTLPPCHVEYDKLVERLITSESPSKIAAGSTDFAVKI
jgi:hypothetical protein